MPELLALDVALLLPPSAAATAATLSAKLPAADFQGLRLDAAHLPHVTLTQLFARANEVEAVLAKVDEVARDSGPLTLRVPGAGGAGGAVWLEIEATPPLTALHERLMEALRGLERPDGGPGAFVGGEGRLRDVLWVAGYRLKSSFHRFAPHVTLGHASRPPALDPFAFEADTLAVCHLGRFCTCQVVFRQWTLSGGTSRR